MRDILTKDISFTTSHYFLFRGFSIRLLSIRIPNMSILKIYSASWCPDCRMAKRVLEEKNIEFDDIDIEEHPEAVKTIIAARGKRVVPTLEYNGKFMDGNHFDRGRFERELEELLA